MKQYIIIIPLFLSVLMFLIIKVAAQEETYLKYWEWQNRMESCIIDSNYAAAEIYYDSIFNNYDYIYPHTVVDGLKLSILNNRSDVYSKRLRKCFQFGINEYILKSDLFYDYYKFDYQKYIGQAEIDSLNRLYINNVDTVLKHTIDSMFTVDQEITDKINRRFIGWIYYPKWRKVSKRHAKYFKRLLQDSGEFPGCRNLGIDENLTALNSEGRIYGINYYPNNSLVFWMLLHYFSYYVEDYEEYNNLLLQSVMNGSLSASKYGDFRDFQSRWRYSKKNNLVYFYNCSHTDPNTKDNIDKIEKRRKEIGLYKYEYEKKMIKYNIKIRKNKMYNKYIVF